VLDDLAAEGQERDDLVAPLRAIGRDAPTPATTLAVSGPNQGSLRPGTTVTQRRPARIST
jgi:hypothetical protein